MSPSLGTPCSKVSDCQLSAVSCQLGSLAARRHNEPAVPCRSKFFSCNAYRKEGDSYMSPLFAQLLFRVPDYALSAVGCELSAWQPSGPAPQRTRRPLPK